MARNGDFGQTIIILGALWGPPWAFPGRLKGLNWPSWMWNIMFNPFWPMFNPFEAAGATYGRKWWFWGKKNIFVAPPCTIYIHHHQIHRNHLNKPVEPFWKFLNVSGLGPQQHIVFWWFLTQRMEGLEELSQFLVCALGISHLTWQGWVWEVSHLMGLQLMAEVPFNGLDNRRVKGRSIEETLYGGT